jgi:toxic protein SymE
MPNKERKIKIVPKHFPRVWKDAVFPEIRLAGKWLQDLGFKCGNFVVITQGESSITITALPEVKAEPQPVKINKRKAKPAFTPELDAMPGNQLFSTLSSEEFREYLAKNKEEKIRKKRVSKERAWENFKKEKLANAQQPPEQASNQNIIQLNPEIKQVADDQIIRLHPLPNQAAEGCNFDTIA